MNSSDANLSQARAKSKLQVSSAIILALWFFPFIVVSLFITPEFILDFGFWFLLYCCPFAIAGILGLVISKKNNPTQFMVLRIIFICFLVYCALNIIASLAFFIVLLIDCITSSGPWEKRDNDDSNLSRGIGLLFMVLFGIGVAYFTIAAWMGIRGSKASKMIRDLLTLGEYQQPLNAGGISAANPANYHTQFRGGNTNFNV